MSKYEVFHTHTTCPVLMFVYVGGSFVNLRFAKRVCRHDMKIPQDDPHARLRSSFTTAALEIAASSALPTRRPEYE